MARPWWVLVSCASVLGCARQPELPAGRCCKDARDADSDDGRVEARSLADSGQTFGLTTQGAPRALRLDGCARDVSVMLAPARDLSELARVCTQGLRAVGHEPLLEEGDGGARLDLTFPVLESRCVRAIAASDGASLALTITDASGNVLAEGSWGESLAIAPLQGPVCVRAAGALHVLVARSAHANVAAQLYQSGPP